jgi:uncharacterized protein (DUF433 family)
MDTVARNTGKIPLTAFDIEAAARVTGLSVSQLQRWDRSGFFHPSLADPNRRRPGSRIYSRDDLVALRAIATLRGARVPLSTLAALPRLLAQRANGEQPTRCLHVVGGRLFLSREEAIASTRRVGSQGELTTIDVESIAAEVESAIARLGERKPDEIGRVTRRRAIMDGVPIIAGTRIPTETIAWFHDHGYSLSDILENFPRLTAEDVNAALAFEHREVPNTPEPILAHR